MSVTCFLCLTASENAKSIDNEDHEILYQIQECLQFKINFNGKLKGSICNDCIKSLTAAHAFLKKIHQAQLSDSVNLYPKFLVYEKETKTLTICDEKFEINNHCIESFQETELNIKDEPFEVEKTEESFEEDIFNEYTSEDDEIKNGSNALAVLKNWKSYPWYCYLCVYSTLSFSTLVGHIKLKHDISDIKKIQFQCVDCTKKISSYTLFLNHVRVNHQPDLKLCCDICSECFSEYAHLAEHRREHNEEKGLQQPAVFQCRYCLKAFPSRQTINSHIITHEQGLKCQECDKSFQCLKYLNRHMEMHKELKYKCNYCNKTFRRQFNKINHERTHTNERPYKCDQCDKMFRLQSTLKGHQLTHSPDRRFKCDQCSSTFNHRYSMKEHMRKHTKENPFSCEECQKTFRYRKSWNRHMHRHAVKKEEKTKIPSNSAKKSEKTTSKAKIKKTDKKNTS